MKDDEAFSDLEARLREWRPAELPTELRTRLHAGFQPTRRAGRWPRRVLAGALVVALGAVGLLTSRFPSSPDVGNDSAVAPSPEPPRTDDPAIAFKPRWVLGESLTMNIYTGVPAGSVPAALRLDEESVSEPGLLPVRSTDGTLPLKVDCQF